MDRYATCPFFIMLCSEFKIYNFTKINVLNMFLVQLFLPLYDNEGNKFNKSYFAYTRRLLVQEFGGVTVYNRAPAEGLWQDENGEVSKDDIIIFEVMTKKIKKTWWKGFKKIVKNTFSQKEIMVRSMTYESI